MAKSKTKAPASAAKQKTRRPQIKGNRRGVYKIASGYYLNWQMLGDTYRKAFSAKKYGSEAKALAAACRLYDYLEQNRDWIQETAREVQAAESLQGEGGVTMTDAAIALLVKKALDKEPSRRVVSS